jgi:hypothetical protein
LVVGGRRRRWAWLAKGGFESFILWGYLDCRVSSLLLFIWMVRSVTSSSVEERVLFGTFGRRHCA